MNRIEKIREYVDNIILHIPDETVRRCGYSHLYGVSQACAMIALKRRENVELATIAGMLHDIYYYSIMDSKDHAHRGSVMAREILISLQSFDVDEIDMICNAIHNHSCKGSKHSSFDEVLIDADVLQHCLYNPLFDVAEHEIQRYGNLKLEFDLL
ncbi:HD superfamily phosphodiesterase [Sedimentibacter acidaminivorans]|uniref:HD superfamily phosphodiesterase n=1 Tax=Sedimentibacter acidaminivorans TaxID=913099 RepID=A0ABS4GHN2_9FIRM|nr:HD domain-containing protein [Sedimentibacter acidaminivorans]MBP1927184.1 HD superfamily phosphodiesterase [Sedimentibacter acidaminivorans]